MKPQSWGPYIWSTIHLVALGYPQKPSSFDKMQYKMFFMSIGNVLPCSKCVKNYTRHFSELPIDDFLESRDSLFNWTVKLHNIVNMENSKPLWDIQDARDYYTAIASGKKLDNLDTQIKIKQSRDNQDQKLVLVSIVLAITIAIGMFYFRRKL